MSSFTYTITDDAAEGTWSSRALTLGDLPFPLEVFPFPLSAFGSGPTWEPTSTHAGPGFDAVFHFTGMDSTDSVLRTGTLTTAASVIAAGSGPWIFDVYVVVEHEAAPSTSTIPDYRLARVGVLTLMTEWVGVATIVLTLGSSRATSNYLWQIDPQGGLGAVGAAWRTTGPGTTRTMTFLFEHRTGEVALTFDVVALTIKAELDVNTSKAERSFYRCPRCGYPVEQIEDLVRDGFTKSYVCSRCYDPPIPPHDWRWPFTTRDE